MFFEVARILEKKRPRYVLLENVKGLLSHDRGQTFGVILQSLDELGYDLQWQIINSKYFVPQNRERVFIVGHLRGEPRPQVFPLRGGEEQNIEETSVDTVYWKNSKDQWVKEARTYTPVVKTHTDYCRTTLLEVTKGAPDAQRVYDPSGIAKTLKGEGGGQGAKTGLYAIPVLTPDRKEKRQNGRRFKNDGEPTFTLTSQDRHGVYDGINIRRLTPLECERLQAFPDDWTKYSFNGSLMSDSQRYKCLGNAVTVDVVSEIVRNLPI
jgi:DNA (cytosine-5)-methyltransferase 1